MKLPPDDNQRVYSRDSLLSKRITLEKVIKFIFLLLIIAAFALFFYSNIMYYKETRSFVGPQERLKARIESGIEHELKEE